MRERQPVFLHNHYYTYVEPIEVVESQAVNQFDGFEPNKIYGLRNGQSWQQVSGPNAPNHISAGHVKIINNETRMVDNLNFYPTVTLVILDY